MRKLSSMKKMYKEKKKYDKNTARTKEKKMTSLES